MRLSLTPSAHRHLLRTLADGCSLADVEHVTSDWAQSHARDCSEVLNLVATKVKPRRPKLGAGPTLKQARKAKKESRKEASARVYEAVNRRAGLTCELCGAAIVSVKREHHHLEGGSKRRAFEAASTVMSVHPQCHRDYHRDPELFRRAVMVWPWSTATRYRADSGSRPRAVMRRGDDERGQR